MAGADPDAVAAELVRLGPGPGIAGCVGLLDLERLSAGARIDLLVALQAQIGWLTAIQQRTLAALDQDAQVHAIRERPRVAQFAAHPNPGAALGIAQAMPVDAR